MASICQAARFFLNEMHLHKFHRIPKPTIAMVHGYCIFGGYFLAGVMDIIFASEDALFLAEVGQCDPGTWDWGVRKMMEVIYEHRFLTARECYEMHMVNRIFPDFETLEREKQSLSGRLSNLIGKFAEYQLATDMRTRKRFSLSVYFSNIKYKNKLNIIDVRLRERFQRNDGKGMEIDVLAESDCGRVIIIEVKKSKDKVENILFCLCRNFIKINSFMILPLMLYFVFFIIYFVFFIFLSAFDTIEPRIREISFISFKR